MAYWPLYAKPANFQGLFNYMKQNEGKIQGGSWTWNAQSDTGVFTFNATDANQAIAIMQIVWHYDGSIPFTENFPNAA